MFEFSFLARRANLDATLTCFTTLSIAAFARGYLLGADGRRLRWYVLAYAACGLAVLVKGPAGLVVPALVAAAVVVSREGPRALLRPHLALGAAIVLGMALAWVLPAVLHAHALAVARGEAPWGYAETLLLRNAAEHAFREDEGKSGAIWYYLERLPGDAAPWSIFFPAAVLAIARWRGARWREADRLAIAWTVPVFVLFSLLRAKRNLYLLPIFPGLGLLVGLVAARVAEEPDRARHPLVAWPLRILFAAGVLGGLVLMGGAAALPRGLAEALARRVPGWYDAIGPALSAGYLARMAALGAGALAAGAAGLSASLRGRARGVLAAAAGAGAVVSLTGALLAFPILDRTYSGERLASRATALAREAGGARIALYGHEHESFPFYMESAGLPRLWTAAELEQFLSAENGSPAIVVGLDHPGILGTPLARGIWRGRQLVILANGAAAERLGAHGR
jgi:4-amino-4-deoxy-L-arabinose transferase-like glycosyltransferase